MLVSFTKSHLVDAKEFREFFPFCSIDVIDVDKKSFLVDLGIYSGTQMDIITWYVDEFCNEFPQHIEFDYSDSFNSITVVYANGCVSFTFFAYENI